MTKSISVSRVFVYITIVTQNIFRLFAYPVLYVVTGMRIHDAHNLQEALDLAKRKDCGLLIAANHVSMLDFAYIQCALLHTKHAFSPIFFVTNTAEHFKSTSFGFLRYFMSSDFVMNSIGAWRIQRGRHDYSISLSNHLALLAEQRIIAIFPEGGINSGKMHGGAGYIATTIPCIIAPILIAKQGKTFCVTCRTQKEYQQTMPTTQENDAEHYRSISRDILS
jgi:1-acyl-sn-glycerol-3-phosphate acyltransferase